MVIDQGSLLDRIDYNVERTAVEVKGADKELTVATGYQKRTVKRKAILLLLLVVVGMFILLGLKLGRRGSNRAPTPEPLPISQEPPGGPLHVRAWDVTNGPQWRYRRDWRRRKRRPWGASG